MQSLAAAIAGQDLTSIHDLLAGDVTMIVDGGLAGTGGAFIGRDAVARELLDGQADISVVGINGAPGLVARRDGKVVATVCARMRAGRVVMLWSVRNPEKLRRWND